MKRIGLALSGGAARGLAHLGVLSVLLNYKIEVEYVSGCSAGAVIGALFCAGMPLASMFKFAPYLAWKRLGTPVRSEDGLLAFDRLERWLIMLIGDLDFKDLEVPLSVVTMDVKTGERVILSAGNLAKAVRASCSIPGLVTPVEIDGRFLVDGGVVDNLPVDAARDLGADFVIGVDVFQPLYNRSRGPLGRGVTAFETLIRNAGGGISRADFLITPATANYTFFRFNRLEELIALGSDAAEAKMSTLLEVLNDHES